MFDDPAVGLRREPFVCGADLVIERMGGALPGAEDGFTLFFSANPFPGPTRNSSAAARNRAVPGTTARPSTWKAGFARRY